MRCPKLTPYITKRKIITALGGYDHRRVIDDGKWYDEENLTLEEYPVAKVRRAHGKLSISDEGSLTGIFEANGRIGYTRYVSSGSPTPTDHGTVTFYEPDATDPSTVDLGLSSTPKKFVHMGAYLIIYPDQKWINTADHTKKGTLNVSVTAAGEVPNHLTLGACLEDGTSIGTYTSSNSEPGSPSDGDYWLDLNPPEQMKKYVESSSSWVNVNAYLKINLGDQYDFSEFEEGDYVKITASGMSEIGHGKDNRLPTDIVKFIKTGETSSKTYIVIASGVGVHEYSTWNVTVQRYIPDMDYVVEANNRLWGCKWGNVDGKNVNEIYASALGSFKEWRTYEGTDADSYAASVGSDGPFTGAVSYQGRPIFFKERCAHIIYGAYPSQYQIVTSECRGVQKGSDRSLAIVDNVLFYKSPDGFCSFDGSQPAVISAPLGLEKYSKVSAGGLDRKYFAAAVDESGKVRILIFDTRLGVWHHAESRSYSTASIDTPIMWTGVGTEMCFIDAADSFASVHTWYGSGSPDSEKVEWFAETGDLGLEDPGKKYVVSVTVRARIAGDSDIRISIRYDGGPWEHVTREGWHPLSAFNVTVPVRRCDHFRLRFDGHGDAQIYSISKLIQEGSETDERIPRARY